MTINYEAFKEEACKDLLASAELKPSVDEVIDVFYSRISNNIIIALEMTGAIDYKESESGGRRCFPSVISKEHEREYCIDLESKFADYKELVERNKKVCSAYKTPNFDLKQAKLFAKEAFLSSFRRTRESYRSIVDKE